MKALVLFKGTGSVDRSLEARGFVVDSLDIDPKCSATWTADVLEWDKWLDMKPGEYNFIWASVPCQHYSRARTRAKLPRNLEGADRIVTRTLQIIDFLKPEGWLLENPLTGLLKTQNIMVGIPICCDVCYCRYSDGVNHRYRKPTRLWGILPGFCPRPMCTRKDPCEFSQSGKHPCHAQRFSCGIKFSLNELYSMPKLLTDDIAQAAAEL